MAVSCYALTGLASIVLPQRCTVAAVLLIWLGATIPQTLVSVSFSVVMNAVAGPGGRLALMSRRWSIFGLAFTLTVMLAGQVLDRLTFPLNYQTVFIGLAMGGLVIYRYSSRIELSDAEPPRHAVNLSRSQRLKGYTNLVRSERAFLFYEQAVRLFGGRGHIRIEGALIVSAAVRLVGFGLFASGRGRHPGSST